MVFQTELFEAAVVPYWQTHLNELEADALPESWRFRRPSYDTKNMDNPILDRYIRGVFRNQVIAFVNARSQQEADRYIYTRSGYACFHTGLLNRQYKPIYAFLERNRNPGNLQYWFFKGFYDDAAPCLRIVHPLPEQPFTAYRYQPWGICPNWEIRSNISHILSEGKNLERIPEKLRNFPNLDRLLQIAVEQARCSASVIPSIVVPQIYQGRLQYLMPLCLLDPNKPMLALTLDPMDGYYVGSTCLTLEMAYQNARLLARPTAPWLRRLVEQLIG